MDELYFSIGSIILDDIVLPDGQTRMGVLGGGAVHAAMGMRAWADQVGLVSPVGRNFQPADEVLLAQYFTLEGIQRRQTLTPRAWQVYEVDGKRSEVFRTSLEEFVAISPMPQQMPEAFLTAAGVHLQCAAPEPLTSWIKHLRAGEDAQNKSHKIIIWEPWDIYCIPENRRVFRDILPLVDVFSPNLIEAKRLTGLDAPLGIAKSLIDDGVPCVALRMGERGSLVFGINGEIHESPTLPVERIVDVTGAGNAYCGGFLVGLVTTGDLLLAGLFGSVSASLALEQFGALIPLQGLQERARIRLAKLQYNRPNPRRVVFDRMAASWDQRPVPSDTGQKLIKVVQSGAIQPGENILDLGSGTGVLITELLDYQPGMLAAVDLSTEMLKILRLRYAQYSTVLPVTADGCKLPFSAGYFKVIYCHAAFPHFPDKKEILSELNRVLQSSGRLVISHAASRAQVNAIHQNADDPILHQDILPPAEELAHLLRQLNWNVIETIDENDIYLIIAEKANPHD
jgi:sugar/nucleoside kinase (ribokinase family)/ubiquinone/menaquinone biosynthesis C-methylase UbiE